MPCGAWQGLFPTGAEISLWQQSQSREVQESQSVFMESRLAVGADVSRGRIPRNIRPRAPHMATSSAFAGGYCALRSAQHPPLPGHK